MSVEVSGAVTVALWTCTPWGALHYEELEEGVFVDVFHGMTLKDLHALFMCALFISLCWAVGNRFLQTILLWRMACFDQFYEEVHSRAAQPQDGSFRPSCCSFLMEDVGCREKALSVYMKWTLFESSSNSFSCSGVQPDIPHWTVI